MPAARTVRTLQSRASQGVGLGESGTPTSISILSHKSTSLMLRLLTSCKTSSCASISSSVYESFSRMSLMGLHPKKARCRQGKVSHDVVRYRVQRKLPQPQQPGFRPKRLPRVWYFFPAFFSFFLFSPPLEIQSERSIASV